MRQERQKGAKSYKDLGALIRNLDFALRKIQLIKYKSRYANLTMFY